MPSSSSRVDGLLRNYRVIPPPPPSSGGVGGSGATKASDATNATSAAGATNAAGAANASVVTAPDGMQRNAVVADARVMGGSGAARDAIIERAKTAGVPQREQIGPTCGLYALGMVMDFWNEKDPKNATALVQDRDVYGKGAQYTREPTTNERILGAAAKLGFTSMGEMFTASQLAATARHFGYDATTHKNATLEDLYKVLDAGHPAIVGFDVDYNGNPSSSYNGERAHYAVIEGYFDLKNANGTMERYLVARHGWAVQKDHVWKASDFDKSWKSLHETSYYGVPGDGVIPGHPELREPANLMKYVVDDHNGKAGIMESLGTKIVEVFPQGDHPAGGTRA